MRRTVKGLILYNPPKLNKIGPCALIIHDLAIAQLISIIYQAQRIGIIFNALLKPYLYAKAVLGWSSWLVFFFFFSWNRRIPLALPFFSFFLVLLFLYSAVFDWRTGTNYYISLNLRTNSEPLWAKNTRWAKSGLSGRLSRALFVTAFVSSLVKMVIPCFIWGHPQQVEHIYWEPRIYRIYSLRVSNASKRGVSSKYHSP